MALLGVFGKDSLYRIVGRHGEAIFSVPSPAVMPDPEFAIVHPGHRVAAEQNSVQDLVVLITDHDRGSVGDVVPLDFLRLLLRKHDGSFWVDGATGHVEVGVLRNESVTFL